MASQSFRVQLKPGRRLVRTVVLLVCLGAFLPGVVGVDAPIGVRAFSAVAVASAAWSLRFLWGAMVVVDAAGVRVLTWWPRARRIAWYRIEQVEVVPGFWYLALGLNSGERVELPCVERFDELYDLVERGRRDLDRVASS